MVPDDVASGGIGKERARPGLEGPVRHAHCISMIRTSFARSGARWAMRAFGKKGTHCHG